VLLTTEVQAPVAPTSRLDVDSSSIVKHTRTLAARGAEHLTRASGDVRGSGASRR
jgi:hypothetical protein